MNYFELFNLKLQYNIDLELLRKKYFELQLKYHPDQSKNPREKEKNLNISIDINNSYNTLKDHILRAEYLLELNNIKISSDITKGQLEKILEDQERLEVIEDVKQLEKFHEDRTSENKILIINLSTAFSNNDLKQALDIIISMKYLTKLLDNTKLKIKNANSRNL